MSNFVKVICIRNCKSNYSEQYCYEDNLYYYIDNIISGSINSLRENGVYPLYRENNHESFHGFYYIDNFIVLSLWREQQLNFVLEDE